MKHPGEIELALYAGGDLGLVSRWRVGNHLRTCDACRSGVELFRQDNGTLRGIAAELPDGVNWARLSQEMTGNIRVGLAAGECVGPAPVHKPKSLAWHAAAVMSAAFVIVLGAMWLNTPREQMERLYGSLRGIHLSPVANVHAPSIPESVVLEGSTSSIGLKTNGATMSFLTSPKDGVAVSVSMQGSVRAQYVDQDTGQVTINKVDYAQ